MIKLVAAFAIALFPFLAMAQSAESNQNKATEYYKKKEYTKAIKELDKTLLSDSNNIKALLLKGHCLYDLKQFQQSYNLFSKVLQIDSTDFEALNQRGLILNTIQEFEGAISDFTKALKLNLPDSIKISLYINLGTAKAAIRDFEGAYESYMSAYKIDSLDVGALNNLAVVCDETGRGNETLKYLFKIVDINPGFIGSYCNIGFKYQGMGEHQKAIDFFDKALKIEKNQPLALNNRGFSKYKIGDLKGGLADIEKSIENYPANSFAFKNRALIYFAMNEYGKGCADLHTAIKLGFTEMYGKEVMDLIDEKCR
ncbi:MAG: CDC27 family protein [Chitinophagaceae bacterium]